MSSLRLKAVSIGLLIAVSVFAYAAWAHTQQQLGAARVEAQDAKAAVEAKQRELEQVQKDAKTNEDAVNGLHAENDRLAAALAERPAPVIRMCSPTRGSSVVPAAPSTPGGAREAAAQGRELPSVPTGDQPGPDIGAGVQLIAVLGERLSAQLRAVQAREAELTQP